MRRPELGHARTRRFGAREEEGVGALGSRERDEDDSVLGHDVRGL